MPRRSAAAAALAVTGVIILAGCGGSSTKEAIGLGNRTIVDPSELSKGLLDKQDLARFKAGSPQRQFLVYWSAVQFQDWATMAGSFEPSVAAQVGVDRIAQALRSQVPILRLQKPRIVSVVSANGQTSVRYAIRDQGGLTLTETATLRRASGRWRLVYDSFLDQALQVAAQNLVQNRIDPNAPHPSARAIAAGEAAATLLRKTLRGPKP